MTEPVIVQKSPFEVEVEAGKTYWWCTCGLSDTQPFCNGAHKEAGVFKPLEWTAPETGTKFMCGCKHTKQAPLCDGSHAKL